MRVQSKRIIGKRGEFTGFDGRVHSCVVVRSEGRILRVNYCPNNKNVVSAWIHANNFTETKP